MLKTRTKKLISTLAFTTLAAAIFSAQAEVQVITIRNMQWSTNPAPLPAGVKVAVLEGSPVQAGEFAIRVRMPVGSKLPIQTSQGKTYVMVTSGSLIAREDANQKNGKKIYAGSFFVVQPNTVLILAAQRRSAELLVFGQGPWAEVVDSTVPTTTPAGSATGAPGVPGDDVVTTPGGGGRVPTDQGTTMPNGTTDMGPSGSRITPTSPTSPSTVSPSFQTNTPSTPGSMVTPGGAPTSPVTTSPGSPGSSATPGFTPTPGTSPTGTSPTGTTGTTITPGGTSSPSTTSPGGTAGSGASTSGAGSTGGGASGGSSGGSR